MLFSPFTIHIFFYSSINELFMVLNYVIHLLISWHVILKSSELRFLFIRSCFAKKWLRMNRNRLVKFQYILSEGIADSFQSELCSTLCKLLKTISKLICQMHALSQWVREFMCVRGRMLVRSVHFQFNFICISGR